LVGERLAQIGALTYVASVETSQAITQGCLQADTALIVASIYAGTIHNHAIARAVEAQVFHSIVDLKAIGAGHGVPLTGARRKRFRDKLISLIRSR
jgi:ribosomal protein S5